MLALASTNEEEEMLYCYGINRCDTVQFGLITTEGGAEDIAEMYGLRGKAGPTFMVKPDRTIIPDLYYSKWGIIKDFKNNEIDSAECSDTINVPAVWFASFPMYDTLLPNTVHKLTWHSEDPEGIAAHALYFSTNESRSWELLDSSSGHDSIYSFQIPNTYTRNGRFKLHVYDTEGNKKEKISVPFTIDSATDLKKQINFSRVSLDIKKSINGISFNWPFNKNAVIKVTDLQGRNIASINVSASITIYSVESLTSGIYLLNFTLDNKQSMVQRFIIQ